MLRFAFAVVFSCLVAVPRAGAATLAGATLPDTFPLEGQTLVLNGIGLRTLTIFNIRAYVVGLYLPQRSADAEAILKSNGPKVILMQFLHSASKAEVDAQFREGVERNCGHGECDPKDASDFDRLVAASPAIAVGDSSTYVFTPGRVRVYANQRMIGDFPNGGLAYQLLAGFIGSRPPSADLKQSLLGRKP